jgi:hypothetical protein
MRSMRKGATRAYAALLAFLATPLPIVALAVQPPTAQRRSCDLVVRTEVLINRPPSEVWPKFLMLDRWMGGLSITPVEGEAGALGEVRLVRPVHDAPPYHNYFIKTVRQVSAQQYVLKVTPEHGADYSGYGDFSLTPSGRNTRLVYNIYLELLSDAGSRAELQGFCDAQYRAIYAEVTRNNHKLKKMVEGGSR